MVAAELSNVTRSSDHADMVEQAMGAIIRLPIIAIDRIHCMFNPGWKNCVTVFAIDKPSSNLKHSVTRECGGDFSDVSTV